MTLKQPRWPRGLPTGLVVNLATLGPLGQRLPAPGTWGSLAGVGYVWLFFVRSRWEVAFAWTVVLSYVAVAITGEACRRLRKDDPGEVILDEFVVMPLVFLGWRAGYAHAWPEWAVALAGFGLFRFFDILKPLGIAKLQRWPEGWGVVADDFAAALAAAASLHAAAWIWAHV